MPFKSIKTYSQKLKGGRSSKTKKYSSVCALTRYHTKYGYCSVLLMMLLLYLLQVLINTKCHPSNWAGWLRNIICCFCALDLKTLMTPEACFLADLDYSTALSFTAHCVCLVGSFLLVLSSWNGSLLDEWDLFALARRFSKVSGKLHGGKIWR